MLGMPNPRSLKDQQGESETNNGLISFAVIYPCTSDAHESEIIPHDLTLLRKSPDVIITAMFNSLYGRPHTVRTTVGRPDYLTIQPPWILGTTSQSSKTLSYWPGIFCISYSDFSDA